MTSTAHAARLHRISEGVVASYIHDISTSTAVGATDTRTLQSDRRRLSALHERASDGSRAANSRGALTRFAPGGSRG